MADQWESLIAEPEFKALPLQDRYKVANNFFDANIKIEEDYQKLEPKDQAKVRHNFLSTLQEQPSFEAKNPNLSAAYETFKGVPRVIAAGATFGGSEKMAELGTRLAGIVTGDQPRAAARNKEIKQEYEQIPTISKTVGEFVGAALPISAMGQGIAFGTKMAKPLLGAAGKSKWFEPFANAIGWAGAGGVYTAAESLIKKQELPKPKELGESAALWGGMEVALRSAGWAGRFGSSVYLISKMTGEPFKDVVKRLVAGAREAELPLGQAAVNLKDNLVYQKKLDAYLKQVEKETEAAYKEAYDYSVSEQVGEMSGGVPTSIASDLKKYKRQLRDEAIERGQIEAEREAVGAQGIMLEERGSNVRPQRQEPTVLEQAAPQIESKTLSSSEQLMSSLQEIASTLKGKLPTWETAKIDNLLRKDPTRWDADDKILYEEMKTKAMGGGNKEIPSEPSALKVEETYNKRTPEQQAAVEEINAKVNKQIDKINKSKAKAEAKAVEKEKMEVQRQKELKAQEEKIAAENKSIDAANWRKADISVVEDSANQRVVGAMDELDRRMGGKVNYLRSGDSYVFKNKKGGTVNANIYHTEEGQIGVEYRITTGKEPVLPYKTQDFRGTKEQVTKFLNNMREGGDPVGSRKFIDAQAKNRWQLPEDVITAEEFRNLQKSKKEEKNGLQEKGKEEGKVIPEEIDPKLRQLLLEREAFAKQGASQRILDSIDKQIRDFGKEVPKADVPSAQTVTAPSKAAPAKPSKPVEKPVEQPKVEAIPEKAEKPKGFVPSPTEQQELEYIKKLAKDKYPNDPDGIKKAAKEYYGIKEQAEPQQTWTREGQPPPKAPVKPKVETKVEAAPKEVPKEQPKAEKPKSPKQLELDRINAELVPLSERIARIQGFGRIPARDLKQKEKELLIARAKLLKSDPSLKSGEFKSGAKTTAPPSFKDKAGRDTMSPQERKDYNEFFLLERNAGVSEADAASHAMDFIKQQRQISMPSVGEPKAATGKEFGDLMKGDLKSMNGVIAGIEQDENGEWTYDPRKGAAGLALGSIALKFKRKMPVRHTNPEMQRSADIFRANENYQIAQSKTNATKIKDSFVRSVVDVQGKAKNMLEKLIDSNPSLKKEARRAKQRLIAASGSNAEASRLNDIHHDKIYKGLSEQEERALDQFIARTRIVEIDRYKGAGKVKHLGDTTGAIQKEFLESGAFQNEHNLTDAQFAMVKDKANDYFNFAKDLLKQKFDAGVLSKESYDAMADLLYSKTAHLSHLEKSMDGIAGRPLSVSQNGVKALKEGSTDYQQLKSKRLLQELTSATQDLIFKNNAAKALMDIAVKSPDNGLVMLARPAAFTKDGKPIYQKAGAGNEKISAMVGGEHVEMIVPREFADSWVRSDPMMSRDLAEKISWLSGSKFLKAGATGYNPLFVLTNMPRDIGLVWSGQQYSKVLPWAVGQFAKDFATTAKDVFTNSGRVIDYVKEGGGMDFLTYYGRFRGQGHAGEHINALSKVMGYLGEKSEIWTRIAHRERAISNLNKTFVKENGRLPNAMEKQLIQEEATIIAREGSIDFAQGGNLAKAVDSGIPYLNAGIQGTRVFMRNYKNDPVGVTVKMAQLMGVAGLLYQWNYDHPGFKQVSAKEKEQNFIIMLPDTMPGFTSYTDNKGEKKYRYIKVAKDQQQRIFTTVVDAIREYQDTGKIPPKQVFDAMKDLASINTPIDIPFVSAGLALANMDTFTYEDIWKGNKDISKFNEAKPDTSAVLQNIANKTQDLPPFMQLSPVRMSTAIGKVIPAGNPLVMGTSGIIRAATGQLGEELGRKGWDQFISDNSPLKRVISTTNPYNEYIESFKEDKALAADKNELQNRDFDRLVEKLAIERTPESYQKVTDYFNQQEEKVQDRLSKRYDKYMKVIDLPDRTFWWLLLNTKSPEVRAKQLYKKLMNAPEGERARIFNTANDIDGIVTDDMTDEWNKLINK